MAKNAPSRAIALSLTPRESVILSDRRAPAPQGAKNLAFGQRREILRRFAPQNDSNMLILVPNAITLMLLGFHDPFQVLKTPLDDPFPLSLDNQFVQDIA